MAEGNGKRFCLLCGSPCQRHGVTGRKPIYCGAGCRERYAEYARHVRNGGLGVCRAEGCDRLATRKGYALCEMHYYRMRRTGDLGARVRKASWAKPEGYVVAWAEGHPLADKKGQAYQHRLVAHKTHGGKCPACHWCGNQTTWADCHVDHLNGDKGDNRPENLVVACATCNRVRGAAWPFLVGLTDRGLAHLLELLAEQRRQQGEGESKV